MFLQGKERHCSYLRGPSLSSRYWISGSHFLCEIPGLTNWSLYLSEDYHVALRHWSLVLRDVISRIRVVFHQDPNWRHWPSVCDEISACWPQPRTLMGDSDQFGLLPSMWIRSFRFHYVHLAGHVFVQPKRVCGGNCKDLIECVSSDINVLFFCNLINIHLDFNKWKNALQKMSSFVILRLPRARNWLFLLRIYYIDLFFQRLQHPYLVRLYLPSWMGKCKKNVNASMFHVTHLTGDTLRRDMSAFMRLGFPLLTPPLKAIIFSNLQQKIAIDRLHDRC